MDSQVRHCIINASNGNGWYPRGTKRLKESLIHHGFNGDVLTWYDFPNDEFEKSNPYNIKASAFLEAIRMGYSKILWLDCSVWAIKDPNPIFDVINEEGYYFWKSGYNCAQTCSDACLDYFGITRDLAETFTDCSTSMFGVNMDNPDAKSFIEDWLQSARDGQFGGSRLHDNQSHDKRFLFHRQDQSCASILANMRDFYMYSGNHFSSYYQKDQPETVIFTMRGM